MVLSLAMITMLLSQRFWNSFRVKKTALIPDNLCAVFFLAVTRCLLLCACLSEHPTLLSEHVFVGVMVDLAAHWFPPATTLGEGGVILEWV